MAVSAGAAPAFEALGLRRLYLGDEAIVETARFSLEGRAIRKVRQSVTRIEKAGYTFAMETLADVPDETMAELERVSAAWRAGVDERGFTMALERLGGAHQHDTVVAIARDGEGHVRGFLHFVPSYGREAVSLSFMRRDPETPNGLTEFLVARSIEAFRERGVEEVSLNFAAFARLLTEPENMLERVGGAGAPLGRRVVPDREPVPLQRQVRSALGAALRPLRGPARPRPRRPRSRLGRGPDPEAAGPPMRLPRGSVARRRGRRCASACSCSRAVALLLPGLGALPRRRAAARARGAELGRGLGRPRPRARRACGGGGDRIPAPLAVDAGARRCARGRPRLRCVVRRDDLRRERPLVRGRRWRSSPSCRSPSSPRWSAFARCRQGLREEAEAAVDDQRLAAHHLGVG